MRRGRDHGPLRHDVRLMPEPLDGDTNCAAHLLYDHIAGSVRRAFPRSATGRRRTAHAFLRL